MSKEKILVTGANGYIGSHLVSFLCNAGFSVIATDIKNNNIDERATYIQHNIFEYSADFDLYAHFQSPSICIHLAWSDGFDHNALNHLVNMPKHFLFLKHLIDSGLNHIAVAGSFREYGCVDGLASEDMNCVIDNFYCLGKAALKDGLTLYLKNKNVCFQWLRPFTVYGNDHLNNSLLSKILIWEKEGKKSFPFTDGMEEYDYIHVNALAEQITAIISQREIAGIINCCSGRPERLKDKVGEFLQENKLHIIPEYGVFPRRAYDSKVIYGDNKKITKIMLKESEK